MGLLDKIKGILFDEEEVEVPVDDTELPERTPKKQAKPEARGLEIIEEKTKYKKKIQL